MTAAAAAGVPLWQAGAGPAGSLSWTPGPVCGGPVRAASPVCSLWQISSLARCTLFSSVLSCTYVRPEGSMFPAQGVALEVSSKEIFASVNKSTMKKQVMTHHEGGNRSFKDRAAIRSSPSDALLFYSTSFHV